MTKSKVSKAKKGSVSLKTTIPQTLVEFLNLRQGDKLAWQMDFTSTSERIAVIRKKEN